MKTGLTAGPSNDIGKIELHHTQMRRSGVTQRNKKQHSCSTIYRRRVFCKWTLL